jgi:nicotinate-nucleotide pyrophosphorylase (carboxylating)
MTGVTVDPIEDIVRRALAEDAPWGDLTSETFLPADARAVAQLVAREPGVLRGVRPLSTAFTLVDPATRVDLLLDDGARFEAGTVIARIDGAARAVLRAERIALNLVQRMSGIATLTAQYVAAVAGTTARVVDTRKTTPGLRALERQAVRDGGGHNHRTSLSDAILVKDNHLAVLAGRGVPIGTAIRDARERVPHTVRIEVEVDRLDQVAAVIDAGVDAILLDNFSLDDLRAGVRLVAGRAIVEASGGITLATIGDVARTGVDVISVGALTHSVRALDLALDVDVADGSGSPGR